MEERDYGINKREVAELLKDCSINPTTQRIEIAHLLLQRPQHLCADEIYRALNSEYEQVSQATIYNTLRLFVEKGVIRELIVSPDRIYYDSNTGVHHHFVDTKSGQISDIDASRVSINIPQIDQLNAEVHEISLIIKGRSRAEPGV
ncbi:MAG: transcriptional repressor [Leptospirales bacterium]|nr:transcriptional repressor [Leptospirales bacterium]